MNAAISAPVSKTYKFHCDVDWMKGAWVKGMVAWNHICFSMPAKDIPDWLFRHELEHVYQQIREGRLRFYLKYFFYQLRYGYSSNPYEVEAHQKQFTPLEPSEEQALWKLREDSIK